MNLVSSQDRKVNYTGIWQGILEEYDNENFFHLSGGAVARASGTAEQESKMQDRHFAYPVPINWTVVLWS